MYTKKKKEGDAVAMKKEVDYTRLFGTIVMKPQMNREKKAETKEREKNLFEIVDDYVEQA